MLKIGKGQLGADAAGWIFEHRFVMQEKLGRALLPVERVHHKDANRTNNVSDNLELWRTKDPYGMRFSDLVCPHCGKPYGC